MSPAEADHRHAAKLAARASGSVPVFETLAAVTSVSPQGEEADARYRQKLMARSKPDAPAPVGEVVSWPAVAEEAPVPEEPKSDKPTGDNRSNKR